MHYICQQTVAISSHMLHQYVHHALLMSHFVTVLSLYHMAGTVESQLLKLNGLFAVRKPSGTTSADVIRELKRRLCRDTGERFRSGRKSKVKIGHGGTLDKHASGVLVIGIGNGTKELGKYLKGNKRYIGSGCLGQETNTYDSSGVVTGELPHSHVTREALEDILKKFTGNIMQVPPIYSALKVNGKRMSSLVQQGIPVEAKPARNVKIHGIQCLEYDLPHFKIDVQCGGGVYIRSLIHDIGKALGTCAHMVSLERTQQGPFTLSEHALFEEDWNLQTITHALQIFHNMKDIDR
ncbi:pseudouridylate synthase TRUB1-like [Ptychodera flava]|uniref:pseudouridylate synthase TRUB1-like n=1 Tax=Ptychodera flava TaxID=63121 RepID=UPI00396AA9A9